MKKIFLFVLMIFPFVVNADIYVWDDQQGNTHFSDTAEPGAKVVAMSETQSYSAAKAPAVEKPTITVKLKPVYKELHISHPADQQTLVKNKQGNVTISVVVHPVLQATHQLRLIMDGKIIATHKKTIFELKHVERGQHILQVQIVDMQGGVLRESATVTFYVQRSRVKHPL